MTALAFDLAWKSAVVAALVLAATALLRSRPATERVALLRLGVVVVLALPLLTALVPALRIQAPAIARIEPVSGPAPNATPRPGPVPNVAPIPGLPAGAAPVRSAAPASTTPSPRISPLTVLAIVWLTGVAALTLRLLGGVATLVLWTRRATPVTDPLWRAALDRAVAGGRRPRLKVSARVASPLSWSWPRGVILIDPATLSRPDRADAVLTHEMGHIRHHDWLFLILSHALVAVLWFNPFVWRLQTELARQSEHAADAWAVRLIDRTDYADALVAMARGARPHAALGMAGPSSDLAGRVAAVLDASRGRGRPWATAVAVVACVGMAVPLAALEWAPKALPAALRPAAAPTPDPAPTTAAAVVALMPDALTAPADPTRARSLSPNALAAVIRQRDRGLAMFEAGARALEAGAAQIHRQMRLVSDPEERAGMLRKIDKLTDKALNLRVQARELAARDPATLTPLSEEEDRQMEAELQNLLVLPTQMDMDMNLDVRADMQVDVASMPLPLPLPMPIASDPPPPPREAIAAGLREGAGRLRADAVRMDADARRIEQDRSPSEESADRAGSLREQAGSLRQEADDLDQQAADVMSD